ncbi:hypothetical protein RJ640_028626 [Escallonia rubra]|uniref:BFN domain-containing protein n=1 Tax=Escallonia rubra TaxID=112253 RepID=A0AA88RFA7_9ASTE|nr:hypothetical protein RJ640_028626 [Escallonia rubra]
MLRAQLTLPPVARFGTATDQSNVCNSISNPQRYSSHHLSLQLKFTQWRRRGRSKSTVFSCKCSRGSFGGKLDGDEHESDDDYVEAFILISGKRASVHVDWKNAGNLLAVIRPLKDMYIRNLFLDERPPSFILLHCSHAYASELSPTSTCAETLRHYRMRIQGFEAEINWQTTGQFIPFSARGKDPRAALDPLGPGLLRRFQSPTIFLKISCDGDFLLPIIVGELAVEKLIDALQEEENEDFPNFFQLVKNIVGKLGYKPGEKDLLMVDARPSDAINVAKRCRAPIYVNKQIVLTDAIRITYGMGRMHGQKSIYDVSLDSAADGPDFLSEELDMVRNMNIAIKEERYSDAGTTRNVYNPTWRDKLLKLRASRQEF